MREVVITGIGFNSPIGNDWESLKEGLLEQKSGVRTLPEWREAFGLQSIVCGIVDLDDFSAIPRKLRRSMGRVSLLNARSMQEAITDSGLEPEAVSNPRTGIAFGSTMGSSDEMFRFVKEVALNGSFTGQNTTAFLKIMSHTVAANMAAMFNIKGRNVPTCSACTSSSMGIGIAYETIRYGLSDVMFAGGCEEAHPLNPGVFEIMAATSTQFNDAPSRTPRPFDAGRDGLVTAEGGGTLVLESLEHARRRSAKIYARVAGFATTCDGEHLTAPSSEGMQRVMELALQDAALDAGQIGYINAHATATPLGDVAESKATHAIFGNSVPVSSTKGYMGHLLGGCGAVESVIALMALRDGLLPANKNLETVDPECAPLDYLQTHREAPIRYAMNNNFAFGGINTSLIFEKV